jgi:GTP:adenosylcobinamide-phosphate guanylyltransferase
MIEPVNAVILAGSRPGREPLANMHSVASKALVPVAGQSMLFHVLQTLLHCKAIGQILVLAQDLKVLESDPDCGALVSDPQVTLATSSSTIASSLEGLLTNEKASFPILITTADNVLLNPSMVDHLVLEAAGSDIAIALVERKILLESYPASERTWLKFRGGQFSGANLFYFGSRRARQVLRYWADVEQDRKKGWKILTIFGPWLLFLALSRLLSVHQLAKRIGKKLDMGVRIVEMPQAEACIDVDKQSDLEMVEQIMLERDRSN